MAMHCVALGLLLSILPTGALFGGRVADFFTNFESSSIEQLMKSMTLSEKAAQMLQVEVKAIDMDVFIPFLGSVLFEGNREVGKNTPEEWHRFNKKLQHQAASGPHKIPLLIGADMVHGNGHMKDTTIFPHNIALGCSQNRTLVRAVGQAAAVESAAVGVNFMFAPCLDIVSDIRWGRTYESFGQDPQWVNELGAAFVEGAKDIDAGMITSAKRFVAAGATRYNTGRDYTKRTKTVELFRNLPALTKAERLDTQQTPEVKSLLDKGDAKLSHEELFTRHMVPYWGAIKSGVASVMASHSSVNGEMNHRNKKLLSYLKADKLGHGMNFKGFVITDYAGIDMLDTSYDKALPDAINAGIDMVMLPGTRHGCNHSQRAASPEQAQKEKKDENKHFAKEVRKQEKKGSKKECPTAQSFVMDIVKHVQSGVIPESRINDAVRRILTVKKESKVLEKPIAPIEWLSRVGGADHRQLAREAVQQSTVLLKNDKQVLPLPAGNKVCVAGRAANNLGMQLGGWSVKAQGEDGNQLTKGITVWQAVQARIPDSVYDESGVCEGFSTVIAVVGEPAYAEGAGDRKDLGLTVQDRHMLENMHSNDASDSHEKRRHILLMISGRPLWIDEVLPHVDSVVASFVPGTEGGDGIVDVLLGKFNPTGKLSVVWPKKSAQLPVLDNIRSNEILFSAGHGLSYPKSEL